MANMDWLNERQDGRRKETEDSRHRVSLLRHRLHPLKVLLCTFHTRTNRRNGFASYRSPTHSALFANERYLAIIIVIIILHTRRSCAICTHSTAV